MIFFARYEASQYGWPQIEPEHLLLGLVHEERLLYGEWLPNGLPDSIRQKIDRSFERRPVTPTSVDLPLSLTGRAVLLHAKDEADRMNSRQIGTEHLLLGLVREETLAARILFENGADLHKLRVRFEQGSEHKEMSSGGSRPWVGAESVQIHGLWWNSAYIRDGVKRCRGRNWHWQKALWKPRDVVVHRATGKISLDCLCSLIRTTSNCSQEDGEKITAQFVRGNFMNRKTTMALDIRTAPNGCARNVLKSSGSAQISFQAHIPISPDPKRFRLPSGLVGDIPLFSF